MLNKLTGETTIKTVKALSGESFRIESAREAAGKLRAAAAAALRLNTIRKITSADLDTQYSLPLDNEYDTTSCFSHPIQAAFLAQGEGGTLFHHRC